MDHAKDLGLVHFTQGVMSFTYCYFIFQQLLGRMEQTFNVSNTPQGSLQLRYLVNLGNLIYAVNQRKLCMALHGPLDVEFALLLPQPRNTILNFQSPVSVSLLDSHFLLLAKSVLKSFQEELFWICRENPPNHVSISNLEKHARRDRFFEINMRQIPILS